MIPFKRSAGLITIGISLLFLIFYFLIPLPDPVFKNPHATVLFDKDGKLLGASIARDEQWRFPEPDSIPDKFKTCLLYFEDEYFYYHPGINPVSLFKAFRENLRAGKVVRGGSTISMQSIRLAFGNQKRSYTRKLLEILSALKLEIHYSKNEILNLYASNAPFGGNVVGISAASWLYFQRPPDELSWSEAAALAVLPNDPASVFPGKNTSLFRNKRNRLLDKLQERGILDSSDCFLAKQEELPRPIIHLPNDAFHLLQTAKKEGFEGQNIHSSLNQILQKSINTLVESHAEKQRGNLVFNAAAIVIDVQSGKVLAYKGNVNSGKDHGEFVDIIRAPRSPGSLLKPFLYAASLDEGIIYPKQLLPDIPMIYRGFAPKNFDKKFRGAVPADAALAGSLNVPFVFLLRDYGYEKLHWKLRDLGMGSLQRPANHYGLSLILGGAETSLWEITGLYAGMVRTYESFRKRPSGFGYANNDFRKHSYLRYDSLSENLTTSGPLSFEAIAYTLRALQQLQRPEEESGWEQFAGSRSIAWKTGTSYGFKDAWAVGCSNHYVVGVWIGNADGEGRPGLVGVKAAAPLLFQIFDLLPGESVFSHPFGQSVNTCTKSGMKAGKHCENLVPLPLPGRLSDSPLCSYHQILNLDSEAKVQVNSSCYDLSQMKRKKWFVLPPVQSWYYKKYHPEYQEPPPFSVACKSAGSHSEMEMVYPKNFTKVYIPVEQDGEKGQAVFEAAHRNPSGTIFWHLDNQFLGSTRHHHQMGVRAEKGLHLLTLVDEKGTSLEIRIEIVN